MTFYIVWTVLTIAVLTEALYSNHVQLLTQEQADARGSQKPAGVLIKHGGVIMDFFVISLLTASLFSRFHSQWATATWLKAGLPCLLAIAALTEVWRRGSYQIDETFNMNGRVTPAGWIHAAYFMFCFTVIVLFFFATTHGITRGYGRVVTVTCAIHMAIGLIQPELAMRGTVNKGNIIAAVVGAIALTIGYYRLPFEN